MYIQNITDLAISEDSIASRKCFSCGGSPSSGLGEHVIPKWLQAEQNLANKTINLLNGTNLPYRQLTVPCCAACNNGYLSQIEKTVMPLFRKGVLETREETLVMGRWLAKILVGLLIKETSLLYDRKDPEQGTIVPATFIENVRQCHFLMHSARKPTSFECLHWQFPFSFYSYEIEDNGLLSGFDLTTNLAGNSIAVRSGKLGVVFINDGGLQMEVGLKGPFSLAGSKISAFQFSEIAARIHYKAALRDATHLYLTAESEQRIDIHQLQVQSYSGPMPNGEGQRIFREMDQVELSYAMANYMNVDRSIVFDEESGFCRTALVDAEGKPIRDPNLPNR